MASIKIWRGEVENDLLPHICAVCGNGTDRTKKVKFTWAPGWIIAFILLGCAGVIAMVILNQILRKTMTVYVPVCEEHESHWFRRKTLPGFVVFGSIFGGLLVIIAAVQGAGDNLMAITAVAYFVFVLASLIAAGVLQLGCVRPTEITDRTITLTSLHKNFVDDLKEDRLNDRDVSGRKGDPYDYDD